MSLCSIHYWDLERKNSSAHYPLANSRQLTQSLFWKPQTYRDSLVHDLLRIDTSETCHSRLSTKKYGCINSRTHTASGLHQSSHRKLTDAPCVACQNLLLMHERRPIPAPSAATFSLHPWHVTNAFYTPIDHGKKTSTLRTDLTEMPWITGSIFPNTTFLFHKDKKMKTTKHLTQGQLHMVTQCTHKAMSS